MLNLDKTYSIKSNATRDARKAVKAGEYPAGTLEVVVVPAGYQIVTRGFIPNDPPETPAEKVLTRTAEWPYAKAVPVQLPIAADRAEAEKNFAEMTEASRMSPSASAAAPKKAKAAKLDAVAEAAARKATRKAAAAAAPARPDGLTDEQTRLLRALADCKAAAFLSKGVEERVGVWIRSREVHDSFSPHNLPMVRVPGIMAGLSRRGLVECGWDKAATVRLTQAGYDAVMGTRA